MAIEQVTQWRWDQLRSLGTSRIVRLTFLVPVLGYFLLFGESFNEFLRLEFGTSDQSGNAPGISYWRVYFLYFGFCFLAFASFLFAIFCPEPVKHHGAAYEFVEREERTLSDHRVAGMRDVLDRRNYEIVRFGRAYPDFDEVAQWVTVDGDNWNIIEQDDEAMNRAAQDLGLIKINVRKLEDARLMTEYFVFLKSTAPKVRAWIAAFYGFGFLLVAIPTIVVFAQVLGAATRSLARFLTTLV